MSHKYYMFEQRECRTPEDQRPKDCAYVFPAWIGADFHNCLQCLHRMGVSPVYAIPGFVPRETVTDAIVVPLPVAAKLKRRRA